MRTIRKPLFLLCLPLLAGIYLAAEPNVVLENALFRYVISRDARNMAFVDRATGTDYLRVAEPSACALIRVRGREHAATSASLAQGRLTLRFGTNGVQAVLRTEVRPSFVTLSVESVSGEEADSLT